jgi:predicted GNAT family N-acyltransferase
MEFGEFSTQDRLYRDALKLREEHLRLPLGLVLSERDMAGDGEQFHYGVVDKGRLIACVSIRPIDRDSVQLRQMVVSPHLRGRGVGALLVSSMEAEIGRRGYRRIEMDARVSAEGFYRKQGYEPDGGIYRHLGIDHVKMQKQIEPLETNRTQARLS